MAFSLPVALSALVCTLCLTRTALAAEKAEGVKLTYHQLGADWPGMCQTGKTQSPINVVTEDMKPIKGSAGMIDIESVGVVSGASMFLTETLPHFEVVWEEFIEEPVIRVPARKKDGDVLAPLSEDLEEDELTMVKIAPLQFHFHNPSENTLNGELLAGGLHIVSAVLEGESEACDKKIKAGSNCFVVLSVFLSEESFYSPFNTLFTKVSRKERAKMRRGGNKAVPFSSVLPKLGKEGSESIGVFDLNTLLPTKSDYATWSGSLTTFPCSEEIMWVQFLQPIPITFKQVSAMRATIARTMGEDCDSKKNGQCSPLRPSFNRREIQPLNGRTVKTGMAF